MADKGIGINECPTHGEYYLDAEDSPCPDCEDGVPDLEPTHYNCCHAPKDLGHMFGCPNSTENQPPGACPDCNGVGEPLPDGADHEEYSRCGNCKGWTYEGGAS